jgi:hypothetical protein
MHPQIIADTSLNRQSVSQFESAETRTENISKTALLANIRSIDAIADSDKKARVLIGLAIGNRIPLREFVECLREVLGGAA